MTMSPDDSFEVGGDIDKVSITLRVAGDTLDPDEVTRVLGRAPSWAARRGDERPSRAGSIRQRTGVWLLKLGESTEWIIEDGITTLLAALPQDAAVWAKVRGLGEVELCVGLHLEAWNRGFSLSPEILGRLSALGIALDFDIYAHGEGDAD